MQKIKILNIGIDNVSSLELLRSLKQGVLVTPNIDHLVKLQKNKELYNLYSKAEWIVCDSKVIYLFSRLLQCSLRDVIPGSSFSRSFICIIRMIWIVGYSYLVLWKVWPLRQWRILIKK